MSQSGSNSPEPEHGGASASSPLKTDDHCVSKIRSFLSAKELGASMDVLLCGAPPSPLSVTPLADLVMRDRKRLRRLERKEYLREVRAYRLAGLVCNDHLDASLPAVGSEPAFKCLPSEYKRRACMDGRTSIPNACSKFGRSNDPIPYVPEPERQQGGQRPIKVENYSEECKASAATGMATCGEVAMTHGDSVTPGQLAVGVPEAKVITSRKGVVIWRREALDFHLSLIRDGGDVSPVDYPGAHRALQRAVEVAGVREKSVGIFGSISPWVESIVHHNGARSPTMTVDYNTPASYDERMETTLMTTMLEADTQFDVIVSYSSIEHDGQGRYNDPLDPDGDLAAIKEVWLKLAPGGWFLLHVPFSGDGNDNFFWYSQRTYGAARLPLLLRGWEFMGCTTKKKVHRREDKLVLTEVAREQSPVIMLRKPSSVNEFDFLDTSKFGGFRCDVGSKKCGLVSAAL